MSKTIYPIGVLIQGQELVDRNNESMLVPVTTRPFAQSLTRLTPANWVEPFRIMRYAHCKIESVIILGPALFDRIELQGVTIYDRRQSNEEDGRLFFAPYRVLQAGQPLILTVRCAPQLFMFDLDRFPQDVDHQEEPIIDCAPNWPGER